MADNEPTFSHQHWQQWQPTPEPEAYHYNAPSPFPQYQRGFQQLPTPFYEFQPTNQGQLANRFYQPDYQRSVVLNSPGQVDSRFYQRPVAQPYYQNNAPNQEKRAIVKLVGDTVHGNVTFTQEKEGGPVTVEGTVLGLPGGLFGFHVHDKGDITGGCLSAGPHFNPYKVNNTYVHLTFS